MAQRTKTVEYVFETGTALRSTVTALAGTNYYTPAAITVHLPETDSTRTIRSVEMIVRARDAESTATARRFDGIRMGIRIDAVAWSDLDLTGTGISATGDHYCVGFVRDVTSYFQTNFTGASHSVEARVEFETDVASNVNNIAIKLRITYEYNDTSATHAKTVRIPIGGLTGALTTTANANFRGPMSTAQIPALDTFLPEASKTYRQIWFEIEATDAGGTTDFNMVLSVSGATSSTRANVEQAQSTSVNYFDIWIPGGGTGVGYFATNAAQEFQAWSSLASRFERCSVLLCVTYTYPRVTSGRVLNSIVIPATAGSTERVQGTTSAEEEIIRAELWIPEANPTLVQSALFCTFMSAGGGTLTTQINAQGSTGAAYTLTNFTQAGYMSLMHRVDHDYGGSTPTLATGRNLLDLQVFQASTNFSAASGLTGVYILNYTCDVHSSGEGVHNHTTWWSIADHMSSAIAGTGVRLITSGIRTPVIPDANVFFQKSFVDMLFNINASSTSSYMAALAKIDAGESAGGGWILHDLSYGSDGEFGVHRQFLTARDRQWNRWTSDVLDLADPETARDWRFTSSHTGQLAGAFVITYHAITFAVSGNVSGSAGGTVTIKVYRNLDGELVGSTSRTGNGSYSVTVYDNSGTYFAEARESSTYLGRSDNLTPT